MGTFSHFRVDFTRWARFCALRVGWCGHTEICLFSLIFSAFPVFISVTAFLLSSALCGHSYFCQLFPIFSPFLAVFGYDQKLDPKWSWWSHIKVPAFVITASFSGVFVYDLPEMKGKDRRFNLLSSLVLCFTYSQRFMRVLRIFSNYACFAYNLRRCNHGWEEGAYAERKASLFSHPVLLFSAVQRIRRLLCSAMICQEAKEGSVPAADDCGGRRAEWISYCWH